MQPLKTYSVVPRLPKKLEALWELAFNYWFAWNNAVEDIFSGIDPKLWRESYKNPVWFLNHIPQKTLEQLGADELFIERLDEAKASLKHYVGKKTSAIPFPEPIDGKPAVAYFSMEYGVTLCLPIYSGGLGILAGDHVKSASDLNISMVAVGLLYTQGYFRQYLTPDGWQQERYPVNDFEQMPVKRLKDANGADVMIDLDLAGQTLYAKVWEAKVGRISLVLLDTNIPENPAHFKQVTARLYGGGLEMRIWQEMLLGIGGVKALRALNLTPKCIHMNEGHSAFAGLERIRFFMKENGLSYEAAAELVAGTSIFTTHTPVPAGNDRFPPDLMQRYFDGYARDMGLAFKVFMALGREDPRDDNESFCMTVLAQRLSRFNNGVSKLHGRVSRAMWRKVWPQYPLEDVPIGAITNGIHVASFVAPDIALLYDRYLGSNWREDPDLTRIWSQADSISETELWRTHERLRARLVDYVRDRLQRQMQAKGVRRKALEVAAEVLDPEALTIGFARRFATYKRANLILQDKERLIRIISNKQKPVQFIFAGKAHPQDNEGKKFIQDLIQLCRTEECRRRMIFVEDYDIEVAQYLVQGCDVWLNTPRRPLEACGTSGMKAMVNGVIQLSVLDGWWAEAYKPDNTIGWGVGLGEEYEDAVYQDFVESQTLYNLLENEVIPEFYDRGQGNAPRAWIRRMKQALKELAPVFNSHRMVEEYARSAYLPAVECYNRLTKDGMAPAGELARWFMEMKINWGSIRVLSVESTAPDRVHVGEQLVVEAKVALGGVTPNDVRVEIYSGPLDNEGGFAQRRTVLMRPSGPLVDGVQTFLGEAEPAEAGRFGFTVRVMPNHPLMLDPHSLGLISWA